MAVRAKRITGRPVLIDQLSDLAAWMQIPQSNDAVPIPRKQPTAITAQSQTEEGFLDPECLHRDRRDLAVQFPKARYALLGYSHDRAAIRCSRNGDYSRLPQRLRIGTGQGSEQGTLRFGKVVLELDSLGTEQKADQRIRGKNELRLAGHLRGQVDLLLQDRVPSETIHHTGDDDRRQGGRREKDHVPLPASPLLVHLLITLRDARLQKIVGLRFSRVARGPLLGLAQPGTLVQKRRIELVVGPLGCRLFQASAGPQVFCILLNPLLETIPIPDQCLMGQLDGGALLLIGRQQASFGETVENGFVRFWVRRRRKLVDTPAPLGCPSLLVDLDQAQKDLSAGFALRVVEAREDLFGVLLQGAGHAAGRVITLDREPPATLAALPERKESMLEQRQRSRLRFNLVQQEIGKPPFELTTRGVGRTFDGAAQFIAGHRTDESLVLRDGRPQIRVGVAAAVEVGPQSEDDDRPALRLPGRLQKVGDECPPVRLVGAEGEDLFELIDEDQEALIGRSPAQGVAGGEVEHPRIRAEIADQVPEGGRRIGEMGCVRQADGKAFQRLLSRFAYGHRPGIAVRNLAALQGRQETRLSQG